METLLQDIRYAIRMLIRKPGFTAVAVLILTLGIGANTAIFSVINAVLIRPLPFKDPDQIVTVWETRSNQGYRKMGVLEPNIIDLREQNQVFEQMGAFWAHAYIGLNLSGDDKPEFVQRARITANLFSVLGVSPMLGRTFLPEEEKSGGDPVVILSHGLWQRRFGSDPDIIGKTLTLNTLNYTVVGVMPAGFGFPSPQMVDNSAKQIDKVELWTPAVLRPNAGGHNYRVIARLKSGVTIEQAHAEIERIEQQYPDRNTGQGVMIVPLREQVVGNVRPVLLVLFGAVGFVLLIACANIANLLLSRTASRQKEITIRAALGASRGRIVQQLLTESVLLSLLGGIFAVMLALWGISSLIALGPENTPRIEEIDLDGRVLGFTFLVSLITGIAFGLAPAIQASRPDLCGGLKEGSRNTTGGIRRYRTRSLLVIAEVALSLVLLIGAGLMVKSFLRLQNVSLGFDPDNILTAQLTLPFAKYGERQQAVVFYQSLLERIDNLPGVKSVGITNFLPMSGADTQTSFHIEGEPPLPAGEFISAAPRWVSSDYFQAMSIPILRGRSLAKEDIENDRHVVVINESMARRFWPDEDPIGKRLTMESLNNPIWHEIVGIVGDVRHSGVDAEPEPEMYFSYLFPSDANSNPWNSMYLVAHTVSAPIGFAAAIRNEVMTLDKDQPVYNIATMEHLLSGSVGQRRFNMLLLGIFAAVALILAVVGIYGVMAYSTAQRSQEIGIRMALGAQQRDVLGLVLRHGMSLALTGVAIGLMGAFALTRLISGLLFGVTATDPVTFASMAILLGGIAMLACYIPARRATRVDPMTALRYE